jgi:Protease inhibitor Inh
MREFGIGLCCVAAGATIAIDLYTGALAQDAQSPKDAVGIMVGAWELSNADHDKVCRLIFRTDFAAGGRKLEVDKSCPGVFPTTKDVAGWAVDDFGALRLLDARGKAVIELTEAETGIYDGFQPGQGRYVLQNAAGATVRSADDMVGDWAIARGTGKPICTLTLASSPALANGSTGVDSLALKVKPGCDTLVARFAPTSWRMNQGELFLISARGQSWRFEENDANTWQRIPEGADPVLLVRQQ